jgi:soluble lytic murein transglycosylase-like protein
MFRGIYTLLGAMMLAILTFFYFETKEIENEAEIAVRGNPINSQSPPCLQMYYYIEKYSEQYGIPRNYAFGIAFKETRYEGPFHWEYNPAQESYVGAIGPMQIMPATANMMWKGKSIKKENLKNDIGFNVETSMKLLRHLYDKYGNWQIVFGAYNTGRPMVNQYALDVYNYKLR